MSRVHAPVISLHQLLCVLVFQREIRVFPQALYRLKRRRSSPSDDQWMLPTEAKWTDLMKWKDVCETFSQWETFTFIHSGGAVIQTHDEYRNKWHWSHWELLSRVWVRDTVRNWDNSERGVVFLYERARNNKRITVFYCRYDTFHNTWVTFLHSSLSDHSISG